MGVNALRSHTQLEGHKLAARGRQQLNLSNYFLGNTKGVTATATTAATTGATPAATTKHTAAVTTPSSGTITTGKSSDLRLAFSSSATLQAEIHWCLNTAVQHHSYSCNEGISE